MADELVSEIGVLVKKHVVASEQRISQLEADLKQCQEVVEHLKREKETLQQSVSQLEAVNKDQKEMETIVSQLQKELGDAKKLLADEDKKNVKRYAKITAENKGLVTEVEALKNKVDLSEKENVAMKNQLAERDKEIQTRSSLFDKKVTDYSSLKEEMQSVREKLKMKEAKLDETLKQLSSYKSKLTASNTRIESFSSLETSIFDYVNNSKKHKKSPKKTTEEEDDGLQINIDEGDYTDADLNMVDINDTTPMILKKGAKQVQSLFDDEYCM